MPDRPSRDAARDSRALRRLLALAQLLTSPIVLVRCSRRSRVRSMSRVERRCVLSDDRHSGSLPPGIRGINVVTEHPVDGAPSPGGLPGMLVSPVLVAASTALDSFAADLERVTRERDDKQALLNTMATVANKLEGRADRAEASLAAAREAMRREADSARGYANVLIGIPAFVSQYNAFDQIARNLERASQEGS